MTSATQLFQAQELQAILIEHAFGLAKKPEIISHGSIATVRLSVFEGDLEVEVSERCFQVSQCTYRSELVGKQFETMESLLMTCSPQYQHRFHQRLSSLLLETTE